MRMSNRQTDRQTDKKTNTKTRGHTETLFAVLLFLKSEWIPAKANSQEVTMTSNTVTTDPVVSERRAANRALWQHICVKEGWCESCSLELPYSPILLDENGKCDLITCGENKIQYSYDGEVSYPECPGESPLTDSTSIHCLSVVELLSIKIRAFRQGLVGLATRADAAIKMSDTCLSCNMRKGWSYTCVACDPARVIKKIEVAQPTDTKSPPTDNDYY